MSRFIAIDIDQNGLFIAAANAVSGGITFDSAIALNEAVPALSVENASALGQKIRSLMQEAKIAAAPVLVCVGRERIVLKDVKYPPGPVEQEPALVRFQAQKDLTDNPEDLLMDYAPAAAVPGESIRKATVIFVRKDLLNVIKMACDSVGLRLQAIVPRPFAAAAGLKYALAKGAIPSPEEANPVLAQLSVWNKGGEFCVTQGSHLLFSRTISGTSLGSENAFVGEVKRSLAAFSAQHPNSPIRAVSYSEGDVPGGGWAGRLQSVLPVPVYAYDPLAEAGPLEHVPARLRGRFYGAVGLLAAKTENVPFGINFLTPRAPKAQPNKYRSRILIGTLLLLVTLAVGFVFGRMAIDRTSRQITQLTADKAELDGQIEDLKTNGKRLAAADEFANRELPWIDIFYDLNDQFPNIDKMRLQEIDGNITVQAAAKPGMPVTTTALPGTKPTGTTMLQPKPGTPDKEKKGTLRILLVAEESAMPQKLTDTMIKEPGFGNVKMSIGGLVGSASSKVQQFTINADVFRRKPEEFSRRIPPPPPPKEPEKVPEAPKEEPVVVPDNPDDVVPLPDDNAPEEGGAQ